MPWKTGMYFSPGMREMQFSRPLIGGNAPPPTQEHIRSRLLSLDFTLARSSRLRNR